MALNTRSEQSAMSEINVTPLVDVMLVLLIVFIVTAPLLMQAVKVNLPKTAAVSPMKPTKTIQMAIDAQGGVFIDQRLIHFETLEAELKKITAQDADPNIQIHADESVRYGRVAQVMAVLQRVGITKLGFVTTPVSRSELAEKNRP
ncbi:MAG: biopolymer transporter ExbD [Betaproteobacteria bacterium CG2_30_59_46]|nr:MAG: biopolymer transporter ExbD [Betaproteobacteria bacterium CG2_30_59_46]PIQ14240.1 MAG: biopolymer transporter ExbD [Hydrogenophilales bacterium CG18_big_fil_WC_8_21_14_2_50_58_12]PIY01013.1 MAG: biopolymer transporter ExbD [Hydrogenophilales bacterium CG_4_10_14_3_um_filter_58_23]PJB08930.1 MAG: biopolymer transporter ExbD [Hydrogenophilales bacterium CG_4_9_14_3_um_filter_59_35]